MLKRLILGTFLVLLPAESLWGWPSSTSDRHEVSDVMTQLFRTNAKPAGIPPDPRTVIKLEEKVSTPTRVSIGVQTNILGVVDAELKTEVDYTRDFSTNTWIFVEGENPDIIRQNSAGVSFFDPGEKRAVRLCSVAASLRLTESYIGKVFLAVGGIDHSRVYEGIEQVLQTSEIAEVKPGESPEMHKRACDDFAKKKYNEVMNTLKALAASRIYWDELSQCNPNVPITNDSVCGRWHDTLFPSVQAWTVPVCERRYGQRNFFCNIRSIKGGDCPYRDPVTKKLVTSGMFEYPCAKGLECSLIKDAGWFSYGKAECRPAKKTEESVSDVILKIKSTSTTH